MTTGPTTSTDPQQRRLATRRSVTRDNAFPIEHGGGYFQILVPSIAPQSAILPPYLPPDPRTRDRVLSSTVRADAMWGAAIGIAITKAAALAWDVKSEIALRSRHAQELLLNADATSISGIGGWVSYMGKQVRDFTCTNNGCFTEIIRASGAYGSKVVGIGHLSSLRMRRTGDPEYPYIYIDRWGRQHVMRWWQLFNLVDMPEPDEMALGQGLSAAERAYPQIKKLAALETYLYEKISGSRPLAIHIVNGLQKQQLEDMINNAANQQSQKGLTAYMGAVVMTTLKPDAPPSLVTIPLAELPDGFNAQEERERADLVYANALGLDPQDLRPMANQQMGAGAQSHVLNQKAEGRGQAAYRQQLTHHLNQLVLDAKTQFLFVERNFADQQSQAAVSQARITAATTLADKQIISPQQAAQLLVDQGEVPKAFLEATDTASTELADTDKPDVVDDVAEGTNPPAKTLVQAAPASGEAAVAPTPLPKATPATPGMAKLKPPTEQKAAPAARKVHSAEALLEAPAVLQSARRLLREARRQVKFKSGGSWATINGHPVFLGGTGGSGGGKTYTPSYGSGGSSKYPTLADYKAGKITHEQALSQLSQDIQAAKKSGDTKAVNTLTSTYYALKKKGPPASEMPTPAPSAIKTHPLVAGTSIHQYAEAMNHQLETGAASHKDLQDFHTKADSAIAAAKSKVTQAEAAIQSAKDAGFEPLPLVIKKYEDAKAELAATQNLKAHVLQTESLYGSPSPKMAPASVAAAGPHTTPGKSAGQEQAELFASHQAGTTSYNDYKAQMAALQAKHGMTNDQLVAAGKQHVKLQLPPPSAPGGSSKYPTVDKYKKGEITHEQFLVQMKSDIAAAKAAGDTKAVNTLTSTYYAIKNKDKPKAPTLGSPAAQAVAQAMGKGKPQQIPPAVPPGVHPYATVLAQAHQKVLAGDASQATYDSLLADAAKQTGLSTTALHTQVLSLQPSSGPLPSISTAKATPVTHKGQTYAAFAPADGNTWGQETYNQHLHALPPAQRDAVKRYTDVWAYGINKSLRAKEHAAETDPGVQHLDKALASAKLPAPVILTRGFYSPSLVAQMEKGLDLNGKTFRDRGYSSTALGTTSKITGKIKMTIHAPAGSPGLYVENISLNPGEYEFLLPRNSHFRLGEYNYVKTALGGGYWNLNVEYLGPATVEGEIE